MPYRSGRTGRARWQRRPTPRRALSLVASCFGGEEGGSRNYIAEDGGRGGGSPLTSSYTRATPRFPKMRKPPAEVSSLGRRMQATAVPGFRYLARLLRGLQ